VRNANLFTDNKQLEDAELAQTPFNERKLMTKIDFRLLPCLCVMYMVTFLDRYADTLTLSHRLSGWD
jgi:hypothetical protein